MTMPEYSGNTDQLAELFYSFLDGVTTEEELRGICDRLMEAFGKGDHVRASMLTKFSFYLVDAR